MPSRKLDVEIKIFGGICIYGADVARCKSVSKSRTTITGYLHPVRTLQSLEQNKDYAMGVHTNAGKVSKYL